ncbi:MAG: peptide chain release factor N(5)-glutamine methyltransferase [Pyrinomonadaceae bacterium]|nr:peptide chain release factor N(5)-glutamine methyltransferase [Pyrinomonadaceae bacterium]
MCKQLKRGVLYSTSFQSTEQIREPEPMTSNETPLTIAEAVQQAAAFLQDADIRESRREAGSIMAHTLRCDRTFLITHGDEDITPANFARFKGYVERRAAHEPPQYITGSQEFYGLDFEVTPDVLIPRPETELLVETALDLLKGIQSPLICDVGTGSGCIIIALLHELSAARATGTDISSAALQVAARNAVRHHVRERLALVVSDCFTALDMTKAKFNIIVSNPPYIAEASIAGLQREVRGFEPHVALTPGIDGLRIIRRLLNEAPGLLTAGGCLVFEIGFDQHEAVRGLIDPQVWMLLDICQDLQSIPRTVALKRRF